MLFALEDAGLRPQPGASLPIAFRGRSLGEFIPDILVNDAVLVELKAVDYLTAADEAQVLNYLKATTIEVGLLLNFGPQPKIRRLAFSNKRKAERPRIIVD